MKGGSGVATDGKRFTSKRNCFSVLLLTMLSRGIVVGLCAMDGTVFESGTASYG
jgi:hypothetical protein